jgi:hypothetical protein
MSIVVVYFTHPNQQSFYGTYLQPIAYRPWMRICLVIFLGWIVIFILYTMLYFMYIRRMERQSIVPRSGIRYNSEGYREDKEDSTTWANQVDESVEKIIQKTSQVTQTLHGRVSELVLRKATSEGNYEADVQASKAVPEVFVHNVPKSNASVAPSTHSSLPSSERDQITAEMIASPIPTVTRSFVSTVTETTNSDSIVIRPRAKGPRVIGLTVPNSLSEKRLSTSSTTPILADGSLSDESRRTSANSAMLTTNNHAVEPSTIECSVPGISTAELSDYIENESTASHTSMPASETSLGGTVKTSNPQALQKKMKGPRPMQSSTPYKEVDTKPSQEESHQSDQQDTLTLVENQTTRNLPVAPPRHSRVKRDSVHTNN